MNALIFFLGAMSALVVILIIAMVTVVLKLKKNQELFREDVRNLYQLREDDTKNLDRSSCDAERDMRQHIQDERAYCMEECKKYTDSRIDKLIEKLSKN